MSMKKKIKCYIYTRVSTVIQVDGYSLDAQKDKLLVICAALGVDCHNLSKSQKVRILKYMKRLGGEWRKIRI